MSEHSGNYRIQSFEELKLLAENGDAEAQLSVAMYSQGRRDRNEEDLRNAFITFQKLAEEDSSTAQTYLGLMYQFGDGIEQNSTKAVYWIRKAAAQGDEDAQGLLRNLYTEREGVEVNCFQAYKRLKIAEISGFHEGGGDGIFDVLERHMTNAEIEEAINLAEAWNAQFKVEPMGILN